jgi:hypothetical protein
MPETGIHRKAGRIRPEVRFSKTASVLLPFACFLAACRNGQSAPAADGSAQAEQGITAVFYISSLESSPARTPDAGPESTGTVFGLPEAETGVPVATPFSVPSCSDNLTFMGDLTYPDNSQVLPGQAIEKRWKVRNSGVCDWGPEYRIRWTGGTALTPQQEFALFPAEAGSEAVIAVLLTAPVRPGRYISNWRAYSPSGAAFGDTLYIDVVVA